MNNAIENFQKAISQYVNDPREMTKNSFNLQFTTNNVVYCRLKPLIMKNISTWIEELQRKGKLVFTLDQLERHFPDKTRKSLELSLYRMGRKQTIKSVYKGFYTIIPPQYQNLGGLTPDLYIDDLMRYLKREYYVSHLSAAALLGSAHQQPQQFFVVHNGRSLRPAKRSIMRINFINKEKWSMNGVLKSKNQTGYFWMSNGTQTCMDVVNDQSKVGGISRVSTIIDELADQVEVDTDILGYYPEAVLQRFGFILDFLGYVELATEFYHKVFQQEPPEHRYPLQSGQPTKGYSALNRWNIVENTKIELDI